MLGEQAKLETLHGVVAEQNGASITELVRPITNAANFLKHAKRDPTEEMDIDEATVQVAIQLASVDFGQVTGRMPPEAEIYTARATVCTIKSIAEQNRSNQRWMKRILQFCPGLRSASWPERKAMGLDMLNKYLAGQLDKGCIPVRRA